MAIQLTSVIVVVAPISVAFGAAALVVGRAAVAGLVVVVDPVAVTGHAIDPVDAVAVVAARCGLPFWPPSSS